MKQEIRQTCKVDSHECDAQGYLSEMMNIDFSKLRISDNTVSQSEIRILEDKFDLLLAFVRFISNGIHPGSCFELALKAEKLLIEMKAL